MSPQLQKREALAAYGSGRVTLRELGRALGLDTWATHDLLRAEGVDVDRGDREETRHVLEDVLAEIDPAAGR